MTQALPGWYPDPSGMQRYRYFTGMDWANNWTNVAPDGTMTPPDQWTDGKQRTYLHDREWQHRALPATPAMVVVKGPNHALHAILTVCTFGMWLPVWIIVTIAGSKVQVTR